MKYVQSLQLDTFYIVNFEYISHLILVFLLFLSRQMPAGIVLAVFFPASIVKHKELTRLFEWLHGLNRESLTE